MYTNAVRDNGVKHVVNLSSVGAQLADKVGPVNGLHDHEIRLNQLKEVNIVHLRPTFFMENMMSSISLIKQQGIFGTPLRPNLFMSMIATHDIAQVAAELLYHLDFHGHSTRELLGQRDLTMEEVTHIIGKAIGKPELKYIQFSYEDTERTLTGMGLSSDMARLFIEMYRSSNEGIFKPTEARSPRNTTPTSFEEFVRTVFAPAYQQQR